MDRQQQTRRLSGSQVEESHPQQRPLHQIEAGLQSGGGCLEAGLLLGCRQAAQVHPDERKGRISSSEGELPACGLLMGTQAQAIMLLEHRLQRLRQERRVKRLTRLQQDSLIPMLWLGELASKEPVMDGHERHRSFYHLRLCLCQDY